MHWMHNVQGQRREKEKLQWKLISQKNSHHNVVEMNDFEHSVHNIV